jgi:hypothetical protein
MIDEGFALLRASVKPEQHSYGAIKVVLRVPFALAASCVLMQLYVCPHTTVYVSSHHYIARCFMCPHATLCVSSYHCMCPHTTTLPAALLYTLR